MVLLFFLVEYYTFNVRKIREFKTTVVKKN